MMSLLSSVRASRAGLEVLPWSVRSLQVWFRRLGSGDELAGLQEV
jgi:hypothetical protein